MRRGEYDLVFDDKANTLIGVGVHAHVPERRITQHKESVRILGVDVYMRPRLSGVKMTS